MGPRNTFVGSRSGKANTSGDENAFFGLLAGTANTSGRGNSFLGPGAGFSNTIGDLNSFVGLNAGGLSTQGSGNSFFGLAAGFNNLTGSNNTIIGYRADVGPSNLTNASAIGAGAYVTQSNSMVLGSINGFNSLVDTNVGIGTTAPKARLHVTGTSWFTGNTTPLPSSAGAGLGIAYSGGTGYVFAYDYATATPQDLGLNASGGNVGVGTAGPLDKLHVNGIIRVETLGASGATTLCRNASNQIASCSSSARYKSNINPFTSGLNLINRLRPVSFKWKDGGALDMGLVAEEVAAIEPLLTTTNTKGQIEGVKYDRVGVVLINAVKEQQQQIEAQHREIDDLRSQVAVLKKLVCLTNPTAEICWNK